MLNVRPPHVRIPFNRIALLCLVLSACGGQPNIEQESTSVGKGGSNGKGGATAFGGASPGSNLFGNSGTTNNVAAAGKHACEGVNDPSCKLVALGPACGDLKVDAEQGEQCDDGNGLPGDGCSGACRIENPDTWSCPTTGGVCVSTVKCGDGRVQAAEVCDDANTAGGDGCAADCARLEPGFECPASGGACVKSCGNGRLEGLEECDDGGLVTGDGCSETCTMEAGFRCPSPGSACVADTRCGNTKVEVGESCDDGNVITGDGCSAACSVEPFWACPPTGGACIYSVQCGDGVITAGVEVCDTGSADPTGCLACANTDPFYDCSVAGQACNKIQECGNGILEGTEACDVGWAGGAEGCVAGCSSVNLAGGYVCFAGKCFVPYAPRCGNSIIDPGEQCDSGAISDPGCTSCTKTAGYLCALPGTACMKETCGDGVRTPSEQCDDGNTVGTDGCTATCTVTTGWVCPEPGRACIPRCGDGKLTGYEQCEAATAGGALPTGCNSACLLNAGYYCTSTAGTIGPSNQPVILSACIPGTSTHRILQPKCVNGAKEPGESCDDNNQVSGDGCTAQCKLEPSCGTGTCVNRCGDGFKLGTEACDDGNTESGDGCSASCNVESAWTCADNTAGAPANLVLKVTYRDVLSRPRSGYTRHPDFESMSGSDVTPNLVKSTLDTDGKPEFNGRCCDKAADPTYCPNGVVSGECPYDQQLTTRANFRQWYRDVTNVTYPIVSTMTLPRQANGSYVFDSGTVGLYPIDDLGWNLPTALREDKATADASVNDGKPHNFGFTSEVRYFFQYKGGESLTFSGDDDVWVFINRRLALDVGGLHPREERTVALNSVATSVGIDIGGLYEIALFHAERHTGASNFKLTLTGFLPAYSQCTPRCGDGVILPGELCDDGKTGTKVPVNPYASPLPDCTKAPDMTNPAKCKDGKNGSGYGYCSADCKAKQFCGDGIKNGTEECDNGVNLDSYGTSGSNLCAPGCKTPSTCGDGAIQNAFGEQCDNGILLNDDSLYGGCTTQCKLGPSCGDHIVQTAAGEICDEGMNNGGYGAASLCGYDCKPAPRCGDGVRQPPESCDAGDENSESIYGGCTTTCTLGPRCGDGQIQSANGEVCDNGVANSDILYGGCNKTCQLGPRCGDGVRNGLEACDLGAANADSSYGGCQTNCTEGPRCGDGTVQQANGEICDSGSNNGRYGFCAADCRSELRCGDGIKNGPEQCDNGAANSDSGYNGCRTDCTLGPRCGDALKNGSEDCDDGQNLGGYGQCAPGCKLGARCGDGIVSPEQGEQCDDGQNLGGYGQCAPGCRLGPRCGDGVRQSENGEECDDGNTSNGDTCSASCKTESWVLL